MLFLENFQNFDSTLNDFPYLKKLFNKYNFNIVKSSCKNDMLYVTLSGERTDRPNYQFKDELEEIVNNKSDIINHHYVDFIMGKKAENKSTYSILFDLNGGICKNYNNEYLKMINFVKNYNIQNFDDLVKQMTLSVKDLNKSIKINKIGGKERKELYLMKDWFIKFLLKNDYIEKVKKHKVNNKYFPLFWTKIPDENSYKGYISFHVAPNKNNKFDINMDDLEKEENEYKRRDLEIRNPERMLDVKELILPLLNNKFVKFTKSLFK